MSDDALDALIALAQEHEGVEAMRLVDEPTDELAAFGVVITLEVITEGKPLLELCVLDGDQSARYLMSLEAFRKRLERIGL